MTLQLENLPDDWLADSLREREVTVLNLDGSNSVHRVQVIHCWRGETEYEEVHDLGEAVMFHHEPLYIEAGSMIRPRLCLTKVGHLRDIAERERERHTLAVERGFAPLDYGELYVQSAEEAWKQREGISVSGPFYRRERGLW